MMYTVTKTLSPNKGYSCTFRNWRAKSHCRFLHGYDLVFSITFGCEEHDLTPEGWVIDFGSLSVLKDRLDETFDHTLLIAEDDPQLDTLAQLGGLDCADVVIMDRIGCEAFAGWFHDRAQEFLLETMQHNRVKIRAAFCHENGANAAGYLP